MYVARVVLLIVFVAAPKRLLASPCETPDSKRGECIRLTECPSISKLYDDADDELDFQFLRRSQCGYDDIYEKVCCPTGSNETVEYIIPEKTFHPYFSQLTPLSSGDTSDDLLASSECGYHTENRIIDGVDTAIDEYPWMALLKYNSSKGLVSGCGGVLIGHRYILTAAHCIASDAAKKLGPIVSVTLGEYDLKTKVDCDKAFQLAFCSESIDVPIDKVIVHENYVQPPKRQNDIALIRLSRKIEFSIFIVPICLPDIKTHTAETKPEKRLFICGWGQTRVNEQSRIKQKAIVPVVDHESCFKIYSANNIFIDQENVVCAGGKGSDTCRGDSGGPLMGPDDNTRYQVLGIVSFGPSTCTVKGVPAIYTSVGRYIDWIKQNIQP